MGDVDMEDALTPAEAQQRYASLLDSVQGERQR